MQELIISYPRSTRNYFRIREQSDTPGRLVQSISGQSLMIDTDNENGRLHVLADVEYSEYVGKAHAKLIYDTDIPQVGPNAKYIEGYLRICFRRQFGDWRIRVEPDGETFFVDTYVGIINHDWYDETSHLYHKGRAYLYNGKAVLVPGVVIRPANVQHAINKIRDVYYGTTEPNEYIDLVSVVMGE